MFILYLCECSPSIHNSDKINTYINAMHFSKYGEYRSGNEPFKSINTGVREDLPFSTLQLSSMYSPQLFIRA